jgi:hypothetical protein
MRKHSERPEVGEMSMDLEVWSSKPFVLPGQLPHAKLWERHPMEWGFDGGGWHVLVLLATRSERATPNDAVVQRIPDASHVAYVTLEPIGADRAGYAFLETVVRALARAASGVWVDPNGEAFAHDEGAMPIE